MSYFLPEGDGERAGAPLALCNKARGLMDGLGASVWTALQQVQRLENPQQRFHSGTRLASKLSRRLFRKFLLFQRWGVR